MLPPIRQHEPKSALSLPVAVKVVSCTLPSSQNRSDLAGLGAKPTCHGRQSNGTVDAPNLQQRCLGMTGCAAYFLVCGGLGLNCGRGLDHRKLRQSVGAKTRTYAGQVVMHAPDLRVLVTGAMSVAIP